MIKTKISSRKNSNSLSKKSVAICLVSVFLFGVIAVPLAHADKYQDQIDAINRENNQKKAAQEQLGSQAASLSDTISKLQGEINTVQTKINDNQKKTEELKAQIVAAEAELVKQKKFLSETIKAMYLEDEISPVEMLASSKNLSTFFDKQQYRESVRSKVKNTLDKVKQLKLDLATQKDTLEKVIQEQQALQSQLASQRAENDRLLGLNQSQQGALNSEIKTNNSRVAQLRAEQAAENAKRFRSSGVTVRPGSNGNDTYPSIWRNAPMDSLLDSWGMYNRECVSWTAWKVAYSGRHMPGWGFLGIANANQWDDNARRAGIPVDGNPQPGDVAVWHIGFYGHVMYVESVNPNGTINISQYNHDFRGTYSEAYNMPTSGLVFIHF